MAGMVVIVVVLVALVAAAVVVLLAAGQAPSRDGEGPLRAFRRGLRGRRRPDAGQVAAARAAAAEPVDVSLGEMLRANVEYGEGYLSSDEISESVHAAAARVLPRRREHDEPAA